MTASIRSATYTYYMAHLEPPSLVRSQIWKRKQFAIGQRLNAQPTGSTFSTHARMCPAAVNPATTFLINANP